MSGAADLEARLRRVLDERYHHRHPFNLRMHEGRLAPDELRTWVRNRYYYQTRIPIKDGLILAKAGDPRFRRSWIRRIRDHEHDWFRHGHHWSDDRLLGGILDGRRTAAAFHVAGRADDRDAHRGQLRGQCGAVGG